MNLTLGHENVDGVQFRVLSLCELCFFAGDNFPQRRKEREERSKLIKSGAQN